MVSKKKCSSYGQELASKHTTRSAVGLNACRWEQQEEDKPAYDVVSPDAAGIVSYRKKHPDVTYGHVGGNVDDGISLGDDAPARKVKRTAHPKANPRAKPRNTDLEFVAAPRKAVVNKSQPRASRQSTPANLRSGLNPQQRKQLRDYSGGAQIKRKIEIYLLRGTPFGQAVSLATSRQRRELAPRAKKGTGKMGKFRSRFAEHDLGGQVYMGGPTVRFTD